MSAPSIQSRIHYEFTVLYLPSDIVTVFVTVEGIAPHEITTRADTVWLDILQCFTHGGFPGVADLLKTLPYEVTGSDTLVIRGSVTERRRVFHALAASCYDTGDVEQPSPDPIPDAAFPYAMSPEAILSVSVEFFRMPRPPYLMVRAHHGAVQSWHVDTMPPPPDLAPQEQNRKQEDMAA